jgi:putative membrane protein
MNKLITAIHGFCMSLADSVPGVSGGTVAFLMGFYDNFINALGNLITGSWEERKKAFFYLINLGIGWIIGFLMAVVVLSSLFESHIYTVSSLFIGFIIFAIPLVIMEEKQCLKDRACMSFFLLIGIAIVAAITHFNPVGGTDNSLNLDNPGLLMYLYIFIAGAIAICAMILPGISGSTLMLIFGLYVPIITGIKDLLHLDFHALPLLIAFGLGIITGVISIIKIIQRALEKHRGATVYLIIGLMIGSIYAVIMGPATLDDPQPPMTFGTFRIIPFLIGGVIIFGMQAMKRFSEKKAAASAATEENGSNTAE